MKPDNILDYPEAPEPTPSRETLASKIFDIVAEVIVIPLAVVTYIPLRILMLFGIDPFNLKDKAD